MNHRQRWEQLMIKKLWGLWTKLTNPFFRATFWSIKPVWFRNLLTWIGHGLVVCGLIALGFWLGALIGAWLGYIAGTLGYLAKEDFLERSTKTVDRYGDVAGPIVLGSALLFVLSVL